MLPLLYARREQGARAEYWHQSSSQAIQDFCGELDGGDSAYYSALRDFCLRLYDGASQPDSRYFLDKTPHYHFVARELMELFPDGKFVFLWRNPLSVLASYLNTYRGGRWQPDYVRMDLLRGIDNLVGAWAEGDARAHAVRYEDLVAGGASAWEGLFSYLDLEFDPEVLSRFRGIELRGRYGDPSGADRYGTLSSEPLEKWRETIRGPLRKAWCRRYLRRLGDERLRAMGYDRARLLDDLERAPSPGPSPFMDLLHVATSFAHQAWKDTAITTPETPWPLGETLRPPPPIHDRLRVRLGLLRAMRSPR